MFQERLTTAPYNFVYCQTVYVKKGYKSKVRCGCSIMNLTVGGFTMVVSVGIDVLKDRYDCFIINVEVKS